MKRIFTQEEKEIILHEYVHNRNGLEKTAKAVKSTAKTVKKFLTEEGVHIRNFGEAAIETNKKRSYSKNESYFSQESHNMAWILGFLASVGTVRKNRNEIKIGLAKKDREILERIREEINIENPIKEYCTSEGHECVSLTWTCEQHKKDLAKYYIVPEKTFILKPPTNLAREYWIDYIRGYFDGDGTICSAGKNAIKSSFCSATKEVLEWILDSLYEDYGIDKVRIFTRQNGQQAPLYYFSYSISSTKKLFNAFYSDENSLCLQRKKNKFIDLIK